MVVRSLVGAGLVASALMMGSSATAATAVADPPNCTAADLAGVMSGVSAGTSAYLFTHPDVNAFFTSLKGLTKDQTVAKVKAYMAQNPQTHDELVGIRQPLQDLKNRCGQAPGA
jgi:hemophore-related protein